MILGGIKFICGEGTSLSPKCADGQNDDRRRWNVIPYGSRKDFHGLQGKLENLVFQQVIINSYKFETRKVWLSPIKNFHRYDPEFPNIKIL